MNRSKTKEWNNRFGDVVHRMQNTVECVQCGNTLIGEIPAVPVICHDCFKHDGIQLKDRTVCMECACDVLEQGILVTRITHPEGFTCADCGEVVE